MFFFKVKRGVLYTAHGGRNYFRISIREYNKAY